MKKLFPVSVIVSVIVALASCGNGTPKADLNNDIDTMSYAIGLAQSDGLKQYLSERLGIDTTYMDEFIKGLNDGANAGDDKKKAAYYAGIQIGQQISGQMYKAINQEIFGEDTTQTISMKNFHAGFVAGITQKDAKMTLEQARMAADRLMNAQRQKATKKQEQELAKKYAAYKNQNEEFLAKNAKNPGVVILPDGLQYKVLTEGKGAMPSDASTVKVQYEGKTIDGKVFDSSYKRNQPFEFSLNQEFIPGWKEVIRLMPAGSKWEVYIPASLGYGAREGNPAIKPFSTLIFTIELLEVK